MVPSIWTAILHFQGAIAWNLNFTVPIYIIFLVTLLVTFILALFIPSIMIRRRDGFENGILSFVERLTVLSGLFIFIDLVSVVIVVVRNIF